MKFIFTTEIVCILSALSSVLAGTLPTTTTATTTTTTQQLALQAALPCLSLESPVSVRDLSDTTDDGRSDVQTTLIKLHSVLSDIKGVLAVFMNEVVPYTWENYKHAKMLNRLRPHLQFRWTVNGIDEKGEQETKRLESLIRISGYALFLNTAVTTRSAKEIYHTSGLALLNALEVETKRATCQLRNLILNVSSRTIHTKALDSQEPNVLSALNNLVSSNGPQQVTRMVTGLALEDMYQTFSHLVITSTGIATDNNQ